MKISWEVRIKMASKRMFNQKVTNADAFLDMPLSTQCLYFHLNMNADDDGFVPNPKTVIRMIGASEDDMKLLILKSYILTFESGVIVIKHWRMHNTLSKGRYTPTTYLEEKDALLLKDNNSYSFNDGVPLNDSKLIEMSKRQCRRTIDEQKTNTDKIRIDKNSIDKNNKAKNPNLNLFAELFGEDSYKFICSNKELMNSFEAWLEYKETGKKKTIYQERGLKTLMTQVVGYSKEFGIDKVIATIEDSISNGYAGICWNKIEKIKVFKKIEPKISNEMTTPEDTEEELVGDDW